MPEETEPPVREFADRGTLWLLESPENLRDLVRLVASEIAERLDFSRAERINRSFIPDDLQKQEADLLYRVPFQEGRGVVLVYVLLEHQSRPDRTMGLRLLSYMVELWQSQIREFKTEKIAASKWRLHPIVPIVFYTGRRKWKSPINLSGLMELPVLLEKYIPEFETLFLNLQETQPEDLMQAQTAIGLALRALQAAEQPQAELATVLEAVVRQLERLPESSQEQWRRAMQYLYLLVRHKREAGEQEDLFEVMDEAVEKRLAEAEEAKMTGAQVLLAQGRKEGKKEGRRESLLELLEAKFGPLGESVITKVNVLSNDRISVLLRQVLTATSLAEMGL